MNKNALIWHNEKRKVRDLAPFDHNPRTLSEKERADLEQSLVRFNLVEIPAINTDNVIIAGHMRLKILIDLGRGDEEIDVRVPNRKLSEKELEEYNIRSNLNTGFKCTSCNCLVSRKKRLHSISIKVFNQRILKIVKKILR